MLLRNFLEPVVVLVVQILVRAIVASDCIGIRGAWSQLPIRNLTDNTVQISLGHIQSVG